MIKKIIAMVSCLAIVFAFAGCEKDGEDKSSSKTTTTTTKPAVTEEITDEELTDALDSDITDTDVDDVDDDSNVDIVDGVIETSDYTITVGDNWNLTTGSDSLVMLTRNAETAEESASNISIMFSDMYNGMSADELAETFKDQYNSMEGYNVESADTTEVGGHEAAEVVLNATSSNMKMKLKQVAVISDNGVAIITYTAFDSYYDQTIDEVNGIINSITIK